MISVLLPTRGRPQSLASSIKSLLGTAFRPDDIEILLATDPDDQCPVFAGRKVTAWTAPERYGYAGLYRYFNHLATLASGDWLMVWNDDATMKTYGWDAIIRLQQPAVLWMNVNHCPGGNLFPVWPRAWSDAAGHVSLASNVDVWLQEIGNRLGRHHRIPVEVFHDRKDITGGHDDQTYAEGRAREPALAGNHPSYYWPDNVAARDRDVAVIAELLR